MFSTIGTYAFCRVRIDVSAQDSEQCAGQGANVTIPFVIETSGRTERSYDIYSRLLKDRIVLLCDEVDDAMASLICAQLLFLESQDPEKEISLYINSPGGSVTAGMAIYDTMQFIAPPVVTLCVGQAASMGAFLLAGGAKGMRYALPNSRMMIHQPSSGYQGQITDMDIHVREGQRLKKVLNRILAENTGNSLARVSAATERDNFMSAEEALKFGLIDRILTSRRDVADLAGKQS